MSQTFPQNLPEELMLVAEEVAELKDILLDVSQQLRRVERRVNIALPSTKRVAALRNKIANGDSKRNVEEARRIIERMTEEMRRGRNIDKELRGMTVKGKLTTVARELGLTHSKLPPKTELIRRIVVKIHEGVLLSERIHAAARSVAEISG